MQTNQLKNPLKMIFDPIKNSKKPLILFGAGGQAALLLDILKKEGISPLCFCDNNSNLWGKHYLGFPVYSYEEIKEKYNQYNLIISVRPLVAKEIMNQLNSSNEINKYFNMCVPFKVDHNLLNYDNVIKNINMYQEVYNLFADNISKDIFVDMINYKLTGDGISLVNKICGDTFFDETLLIKSNSHVFVDVGAYTGDTIMKFCQFNGDDYKKIIAIELEKGNFECLTKFVKYGRLTNVELHNIGGWSKKTKMRCFTYSNMNFENANLYKEASLMADAEKRIYVEQENEKPLILEIDVDSVDNILNGQCATLIKINAISADLEIIKGCNKIIKQWKPCLLVEYGCKPEHILEIPLLLKKIQPSYKIFLRQKRIFGDSKTILYAI